MKPPAFRLRAQSSKLSSLSTPHTRPQNHQRITRLYSSSPSPPQPLSRPPRTIFSGIQPTGIPHIGNYLGALQQWVSLQNYSTPEDKLLFSIVDLHAITVKQDPAQLARWKREMFASLLAAGIEPGSKVEGRGKVTLFNQSSAGGHTDLMWILSCTASMGYLSRMTQWKSKLSLKDDSSPLDESAKSKLKLGLFSYPVLQAADVLVHRATHVPVGEDQSQHLEFARECATNFNSAYGPHLVSPQTLISPAKRVMSLQNPASKMSKSDPNPNSRILITDTPSEINKKIMSAVTDSTNAISYDPVNRRAVSNLVELLSHFDKKGRSAVELGKVHEGVGLGVFKKLLSDSIAETLEPIRQRYESLIEEDQGKYLDSVAENGAKEARASANSTMVVVKEAVGLSW